MPGLGIGAIPPRRLLWMWSWRLGFHQSIVLGDAGIRGIIPPPVVISGWVVTQTGNHPFTNAPSLKRQNGNTVFFYGYSRHLKGRGFIDEVINTLAFSFSKAISVVILTLAANAEKKREAANLILETWRNLHFPLVSHDSWRKGWSGLIMEPFIQSIQCMKNEDQDKPKTMILIFWL